MNKAKFIIPLISIIIGLLMIQFFKNTYPCTISGIGCESAFHMLKDTWIETLGTCFFLSGIITIIYISRLDK